MRVVYFTAGTVGAGHVMRGLAIEKGLRRAGASGAIIVVGPTLLHSTFGLDYRSVPIVPGELASSDTAPDTTLGRTLIELSPDLLIVDLFWAPLVHLLPILRCPAWLLVRQVPRMWFDGPPELPFRPAQFERILAIEPGTSSPVHETIDPIVVTNPDEVLPREALRERVGVGDRGRLVVVAQAGRPGECALLARAEAGRDPDAVVHAFGLEAPIDEPGVSGHHIGELFPLSRWLAGADAIVSGAGYNAFWEARWLGYASRTRFVSFERPLDDQAWRVGACSGYRPSDNGADLLARRILRG